MQVPPSGFWQSVHAARRRVVFFRGVNGTEPGMDGLARPAGWRAWFALAGLTALALLMLIVLLPVVVLLAVVGFAVVGINALRRWAGGALRPRPRDGDGRRNVRVLVREQ
ncbi:MAG: hypothetical protein KF869_07225 [Phycisphaeraceae bacterium]|nr:hypothetical protein [Phycisphaeraceae bacterium]